MSSQPDASPDLASRIVRTAFPGVIVVVTMLVLTARAAHPLDNTDTYFHLRFGHEFLHGWSLWHPGSPSTFATASWVPTQWLPEIVMAQTESWFGLGGVAWLGGLMYLGLAVTLYLSCRRWADPLVCAVVLCLAVVACSTGLSVRPQVISYVLTTVVAAAWLRAFENRTTPWWIVPISWVWAMCHGMWVIGVVVSVVAAVGIVLDGEPLARRVKVLGVPVLSLAVGLLTPVGPRLLGAVVQVGDRRSYFAEWAVPTLVSSRGGPLLVLLAVAAVGMIRGRRTPWTEMMLLGLAALLAIYSNRTVPPAALIAALLAARRLQATIGPVRPPRLPGRLAVVGAAVTCLGLLAAVAPATAGDAPGEQGGIDTVLQALPPGTPLLTEVSPGGYVVWRYPQLDPVMYGYGDTYTTAELDRNADIIDLAPGWDDELRRTGAVTAVLRTELPLTYALLRDRWTIQAGGDSVVLLRAPAGWLEDPSP